MNQTRPLSLSEETLIGGLRAFPDPGPGDPAAARPRARGGHRRRRAAAASTIWQALPGVLALTAILLAGVAVATHPAARWLVYTAWMVPVAELVLLTAGQACARWRPREAAPGKFTEAIIQITTTGAEHARVTEIIDQIRSYTLKMDYQIWVVTEPGTRSDYPFADRVLIVPASFAAKSGRKARALEYSRQARSSEGLARADVKIIFNDDDVSLTEGYISAAFAADYDICEGVVTPRSAYATRPLGHFLASHADDIRTHACLVYCSVFQGILGWPLHVHGEGLTVTGEAEAEITWDWPVIASEDLVFGQRAARAKGLPKTPLS